MTVTPTYKRLLNYTLVLFCLTLFVRVFLLFYYKSNSGAVDQNVIYGIQRVIAGQQLYQNPEQAPFAIMQYTPLFYHLTGWLCRAAGISATAVQSIYIAARIGALVCNLLTILLAASCINLTLRNRRQSLLYALPVLMVLTIHYYSRGDSLHLLFFVAAIYCTLRWVQKPGAGLLLGMSLTTALCILSKQSGILLPAILCTYLFFGQRKYSAAILYGFLSVAFFAGMLWLITGGQLYPFYQNAYLGLKNGFDFWFPVTIFTSQFYFDLIPCYVLGILLAYIWRKRSTGAGKQLLAYGMFLSFAFAVITGLKIGSSNNYFTELLVFIIIALPGLLKSDVAEMQLLRTKNKTIRLRHFALFCFTVLITSKAIGPFSAVFIERWYKAEKGLYASANGLHNYFTKELQLQPGQYIYFTDRNFLDNVFFGQSLLPNKDVANQVYFANPETIDFSAFVNGMNSGLVRYIVTDTAGKGINVSEQELPFVRFDEHAFTKKATVYGYHIFAYNGQ